jgi:hypothetical protein
MAMALQAAVEWLNEQQCDQRRFLYGAGAGHGDACGKGAILFC